MFTKDWLLCGVHWCWCWCLCQMNFVSFAPTALFMRKTTLLSIKYGYVRITRAQRRRRKVRSEMTERKINSLNCEQVWDAQTRLPGQRTRVRRDGTRRRKRDVADRASVPRRATWQLPNRADAAEIGVNAAQIGPTRSVSAESGRNSKKKKGAKCTV